MDCPKCGGQSSCKDGVVKGRQRHFCKGCGHRYTVSQRAGTGDRAVRRQALELYLEGLGFRSIGRILGFSNVTILNWIRAFGEQVTAVRSEGPARVVELDELHSYVGSKKTTAGSGLLLIEVGGSSSAARWAPAAPRRARSSGIQSKTTASPMS